MKIYSIGLVIYACLILLLGTIEYLTTKSVLSFWVSFAFFVPYIIFAMALFKRKVFGGVICVGLTCLLLGFFLYRYFMTHQLFPIGIMLILSFFALIFCLLAIRKIRKET
ncbi:MAG: hypothetical protein K940chlam8_00505 [Chlamydiae bacterium]|nr:hypothetical protein [Chlamydiota bacterium]